MVTAEAKLAAIFAELLFEVGQRFGIEIIGLGGYVGQIGVIKSGEPDIGILHHGNQIRPHLILNKRLRISVVKSHHGIAVFIAEEREAVDIIDLCVDDGICILRLHSAQNGYAKPHGIPAAHKVGIEDKDLTVAVNRSPKQWHHAALVGVRVGGVFKNILAAGRVDPDILYRERIIVADNVALLRKQPLKGLKTGNRRLTCS